MTATNDAVGRSLFNAVRGYFQLIAHSVALSGSLPDQILGEGYTSFGGRNYGQWKDDAIDDLFRAQSAEPDPEKRKALIHDFQRTPDLFSTASAKMPLSPKVNSPPSATTDGGAAAASPSYALPTNLSSALSHLDDDQLDRLLSAVISELKQRGKKLPKSGEPSEPSRKQRTKEVTPPLAQGKLNAVLAAFKAGVTPARIAREFGISQADVRKALDSDKKK